MTPRALCVLDHEWARARIAKARGYEIVISSGVEIVQRAPFGVSPFFPSPIFSTPGRDRDKSEILVRAFKSPSISQLPSSVRVHPR